MNEIEVAMAKHFATKGWAAIFIVWENGVKMNPRVLMIYW